MRTVDQILIRESVDRIFQVASEVERWPEILAHYRWVRVLERRDGGGTVEMAAWRPFGALRYPTWWVSEMTVDRAACEIRYRHVRGMTRGMDVVWRFDSQARSNPEGWARHSAALERNVLQDSASPSPGFSLGITSGEPPQNDGVLVTIVHEWRGPEWPLIGRLAANLVIGPVFIHGIAARTLAGIKRAVEGAG